MLISHFFNKEVFMPLTVSANRGLLLPGGTTRDKRLTDIDAIRRSLITVDTDMQKALARSIRANFPGDVVPVVGTSRNYPPMNIEINEVTAWVSETTDVDLIANIFLNGESVMLVKILAGAVKVTLIPEFTFTVATSDFLTVDVVSGTGKNLTIRMDYLPV